MIKRTEHISDEHIKGLNAWIQSDWTQSRSTEPLDREKTEKAFAWAYEKAFAQRERDKMGKTPKKTPPVYWTKDPMEMSKKAAELNAAGKISTREEKEVSMYVHLCNWLFLNLDLKLHVFSDECSRKASSWNFSCAPEIDSLLVNDVQTLSELDKKRQDLIKRFWNEKSNVGWYWSTYYSHAFYPHIFMDVAATNEEDSQWSLTKEEVLSYLEQVKFFIDNSHFFIMTPKGVVVSERPSEIHYDDRNRLHNETGIAYGYPETNYGYYMWHGIRVKPHLITNPEKITVEEIESEDNLEIKRVLVDRYGMDRYMSDSGAEKIHEDDYGILLRKNMGRDEPVLVVKVVNSSPEPDGTFKDYFIRVNPECRPLLLDNSLGDPQELTARNAVASTFGLRGEEYAPLIQT